MGFNGDNIEWHQAKIREYFQKCFDEVYNPFSRNSEELVRALLAFVNDEKHTGPEADSAKVFIAEKQVKLVEETLHCIQTLKSMMQGEGYSTEVALLEDFKEDLGEDDTAVIKTPNLNKIIDDFASYNIAFNGIYPKITHIHREVENIAGGCDVITRKSYLWPNPRQSHLALDDIATPDKSAGFVPEFNRKFLAFHGEHSNDIEGSAFKSLLDTIVHNLHQIIDGMNKGALDITNYNGTKDNISWKNPKDILAPEDAKEYLRFFEAYKAYLNGDIKRCQVYLYDPVNLNNGNYINDREDLNIAGVYPLSVRRFYNAQSDRSGYFGKGWTSLFDMHLTKEGEDDDSKIKVLFSDGHEGSYVRYFTKASTNEKKRKDNEAVSNTDSKKYDLDEVGEIEFVTTKDGRAVVKEDYENEEKEYIEEHGESGRLIEYKNHYRLIQDDGSYTEFKKNGKISAFGNERCELARVEYDGERPLGICDEYRYIRLYFNDNGYICTAKDNTGRAVRYEYEDKNGSNLLTLVTYPDGATRKYRYDECGVINEVDTPNGTTFLKNEYDDKKRVTKQSFPDGGVITYSYDEENHITTATEQNGLKVEYLSDEFGRHIGTRYPGQGIGESFTYNDKNEKTTVTDKRGYTTRFSYDNRGHLTKVIDAKGNITNITYNAAGKPIVVKGPDGATYKYSYNSYGELTNVVNPLNEENRIYYDDNGQVERIRDAEGNYTYLKYDDNKDIIYVKDSKGVETFYERDNLGRVISTKNALGAETTYEYDVMDRISKVTDPLGNVTEYAYDMAGKLIHVVNPDKTVKIWKRNNIGKVSEYIDEAGRKTFIKYNNAWDEEEIILPNGGKITYEYDLLKRLIKVVDPEHREVSYDYDENGNVIAEYNGDIKVRSVTYDAVGNVKSETDALGRVKRYDYDLNGNIIAVIDAAGNRYTREVDALGRITKETDALGNSASYTYTKLGDIQSITDAEGRVRRFDYKKGQLIATYFCDRLEQKLIYDRLGRVEKRSFVDGYEMSYSYDALDRVEKVEGSDGRTVVYEYDAMGRVIKVIGGRSTTLYAYTATGRLKSVVDALGNETAYTYDALDNLKSVHRAEGLVDDAEKAGDIFPTVGKDGHVTIYEYDLSGRVTTVFDALGQEEHYEYDQYGRLKKKIDKEGLNTIYTYYVDNQIKSIGYDDGKSVEMCYDVLGNLKKFNDWQGETYIESDLLGRVVKVTDFDDRTIEYGYTKTGERDFIIYPNGEKAQYKYDDNMRISQVIVGENVTTYHYDDFNRLSSKSFSNGSSTKYDYYQGGKIKQIINSDINGVLDEYIFRYNNFGLKESVQKNRRDMNDINGSYTYEYDLLNRLRKISFNGNTKKSYSYDAYGNRIEFIDANRKTSYYYDEADRLLSAIEIEDGKICNELQYAYDKRGNIREITKNQENIKKYVFDCQNLLIQAVDKTQGEVNYKYNGLGFRTEMFTKDKHFNYIYDITRVIYNLLECRSENHIEDYVYDNNVMGLITQNEMSYYMLDEMGTTNWITGSDGTVYRGYAYDEFGSINRKYSKNLGYTKHDNIIQPFAFTGYQNDEVSGLYFAQARYYNSNVGRFITLDKVDGILANPETQNRYSYCFSNPIMYTDCSGYWCGIDDLVAAGIGAAAGVTGQLVGDLVTSATTGKWQLSSAEEYFGAAVGGAVGGVVTLYAGPVVGAAADGFVSTLTSEGIQSATGKSNKSAGEVLVNAAWDGAISAATCGGLELLGKGVNKVTGKLAEKMNIKIPSKELVGIDDVGKKAKNIIKNANEEADNILRPLKYREMPKKRMKLYKKADNIKKEALNKVMDYTIKNSKTMFIVEMIGSVKDNFIKHFNINNHSISSLTKYDSIFNYSANVDNNMPYIQYYEEGECC